MSQPTETPNPTAAPAPAPAPAAAATPKPAPAAGSAQQPQGERRFGGGRGPQGGQRNGRPQFGNNNRGGGARGGSRDGRRDGRGGEVPAEADYEEKNLEVARVTRVTKGGKRMRFRTLSVIGNRKGRVGFGIAKGIDVAAASNKAVTQARKALLTVPLVNETIPHRVDAKFGASSILLKPAPKGTGVKAGGAVRSVLELAGVPNVVAKILGSSNKINNVKATFKALKQLRAPLKAVEAAKAPEASPAPKN